MSASEVLRGARIRRVDAPSEQLLSLSLAAGELRVALLLGLGPSARGFGLCAERPPGNARTPFARELKRILEGGRLLSIAETNSGNAFLLIARGPARLGLLAGGRGAAPEATLWDEQGAPLAALPGDAPAATLAARREDALTAPELERDLDALYGSGTRLLQSQADALLARERAEIARALSTARTRLERRLAAVEADLARGDEVETLRRNAGLLLSNLHALPRGTETATLLDPSSDPPREVSVRVDPRLGPRDQAEAWFKRARKLDRGAKVSGERAAETRASLDAIRALETQLAAAGTLDALVEVARAARERGVEIAVTPSAEPARKRAPAPRLPYREFVGSGSRPIRVGRGADDNDELTLHHAKPHDLWLHARGEAGAHVVVPLRREEACPPELLCDAATLAAHFSQARGHAVVEVTYVPRRYVRKPRKAPAGQVSVEREKVFRLQLEPARLKRLLAAERGKGP
jgi:predicted ribosome quality control (RQC) complex YloA/Tae2 family protein